MSSTKIDKSLLPTKCAVCPTPLRFNFLMEYNGSSKSVTAFHIKCYYKLRLKEKIEEIKQLILDVFKNDKIL